MVEPVIFLDIDGVLNRITTGPSKFEPGCVRAFNKILRAVPEAKVVLSSAWRHLIGSTFTQESFVYMLYTHGLMVRGRFLGHTERETAEVTPRSKQIYNWVEMNGVDRFVAIDDLPLGMPEHYQTDAAEGLTMEDADAIIKMLTEAA